LGNINKKTKKNGLTESTLKSKQFQYRKSPLMKNKVQTTLRGFTGGIAIPLVPLREGFGEGYSENPP